VSPAWASHIRTMFRSSIASIAALLIELGLVQLCDWLKVEPAISYAGVQLIGTLLTFAGNKYWAFEASATGRGMIEGTRAAIVFGGSFVFNTALSSLGSYVLHLPPVLAFLGSQAVVWLCWNFPMNRWWVFPHQHHHEPPASAATPNAGA
jgi:putative flippase GtrA